MPTIFDYGDMRDLGEGTFRSIQDRVLRKSRRGMNDVNWDPQASSLTRQAWDYQQELADRMGEVPGMGDATSNAEGALGQAQPDTGIDGSVFATCGKAALIGAFAGFVIGKVGLVKSILGIGAVYLAYEWVGQQQPQSASTGT